MCALNTVLAAAVATLTLVGGLAPARAASTNPDILLGQVGGAAATARGAVAVQEVTPDRGKRGVAVSPVSVGGPSSSTARVAQPQAALDRCEAILAGRTPPVEGLDCSAGQLEELRQQAAEADASRPPQTVDVDSLSQDLGSAAGAPEATDPTTGLPAIVVLTPGG